ncbi:MAG: FAD-binding oxidoreductase [Pseudomonadota bacterium]
MLNKTLQSRLEQLPGCELFTPTSSAFDEARAIWNAMIERRPAAVVRCQSNEAVRIALLSAREAGCAISVKGGGHNIAGTAVSQGALMLDLSAMNAISIDPAARVANVQGGATWAQFDASAQRHGLAAPGGVVSSTGVGGLTLGGGFGWQARRRGLAADNLLEADVILANGELITTSARNYPDLFWAIRGGGGNFGIVTRFHFRLHDVGPTILFGPTFFSLDDAPTVLHAYAQMAGELPREACVWANIMTAPPLPALPEASHGTKVLTLMQFFGGDPTLGRKHLAPLYGGVRPLGDALAPRPFVEAQQFLDPTYAHGARNYWRSHNHLELSAGLIDTLVELAPDLPTPESELLICQLGGAVAEVPNAESAFPHRQIPFISTPGVRWHSADDDAPTIEWLRNASARIEAFSVPGRYVNFIADTDDQSAAAYGPNLERLALVKSTYDPNNVFHSNQNIVPVASDTGPCDGREKQSPSPAT